MSDNGSTSLRAAREDKGLRKEEVAARLGISVRTLERWEKGETPVKGYGIRQLAAIYGVTPEALAA